MYQNTFFKFKLLFILFIMDSIHAQSDKQLIIEQVASSFSLGEGPHWDENNNLLYFVDIPEQKVYCWNPETNKLTHTYLKNGPVGVAIPIANKKNTFVAGSGNEVVEFIWDSNADNNNPDIKVITSVDNDRNDTRLNDGKVDAKGRFWAGTMGEKNNVITPNRGSLYRFSLDGTPTKMISPVSISNGLAWSHNNDIFYYIDSPTKKIVAYDFNDLTGDISNKRTIFDLEENNIPGVPDGMTIDSAGNLWIAVYDGGRVLQVDPNTGKLLRTVNLPATKITSVAFGGRNKDTLYVTSANHGLTEAELIKQPAAGSVFSVDGLGVTGSSMFEYRLFSRN